jgi:hypothetical protein
MFCVGSTTHLLASQKQKGADNTEYYWRPYMTVQVIGYNTPYVYGKRKSQGKRETTNSSFLSSRLSDLD